MTFWSGERLTARLQTLVTDFDARRVDCASYRLRLGEQAFVTTDTFNSGEPGAPLTQVLSSNAPNITIVIQPGQFAFLLTEETVTVPPDAIALISMRAGLKFKGLINVSGFHVDPGFKGKLIFGVYNAGPAPIILEKGQQLFLIVYADLDRVSAKIYHGDANSRVGIGANLIQGMTGQVFSPMRLKRQMGEIERAQLAMANDLADIKARGRTWDALSMGFIGLLLAIVLAFGASDFLKVALGGWIKGATDLYVKNITEEVEKLNKNTETGSNQQNKAKATVKADDEK